MKISILNLFIFVGILFSNATQAEIYKWKDKDGFTRYSDSPPADSIKTETLGKKKTKSSTQTQLPTVAINPLAPQAVANNAPTQGDAPAPKSAEETAAQKRSVDAEAEKIAKQEKEAQAKMKAENCKSAKSNLKSYNQGGRIAIMNDKGETEYLDDAGLKKGADKSRGEVSKYCN